MAYCYLNATLLPTHDKNGIALILIMLLSIQQL